MDILIDGLDEFQATGTKCPHSKHSRYSLASKPTKPRTCKSVPGSAGIGP